MGAGFGGLQVSAQLSDEFGDGVDIVLIDRSEGFVFGFSKLDVMFGRKDKNAVLHAYRDLVKPGVQFVSANIESIDPTTKSVTTDVGSFEGDILVVALGADLDPGATPGLIDGGHEFYTEAGAFALSKVLDDFDGGRVVVGLTSTPFKCPPAPSETVLMLHDLLTRRGLRGQSTISLVMPFQVPIPPSPSASQALLAAFAEREITWCPETLVCELDPERKVAIAADGMELDYDLFLGVPKHHAPTVVVDAGLTVDGWIPVNSLTLETSFPDVYAIGDVTSVGTPKAGVYSEGQAGVVAARIAARIRGQIASSEYDGHGICYLEFGGGRVARVATTFLTGQRPVGEFDAPSLAYVDDKHEFAVSRIRRWFGRSA